MTLRKVFFISLLWMGFTLQGQNKQLLYDFVEIPQAALVNPGVLIDFQWYAGVPLLSGNSFQVGSSGITVNDIFANNGVNVNTKIRNLVYSKLNKRDELSGTLQLELLNFGFRGKNPNNFYTAGIYTEVDAIGYWFKDYAILALDGNAGRLNQPFDLGDLKTRGEVVNVFHIGFNKTVNRKLTLGLRGKIYSNILDFNSTKNSGYFVTTEGENNIYESIVNSDLELRSSGINELKDAYDANSLASTLTRKSFFGGNLGLGLDFGFTYNFNKQTVLTGSLLDLGFIYHTKDVYNYTLKGATSIEGVEIILPNDALNPNTDFWQDLIDDIQNVLPAEKNQESYVAFRPTKLNVSLRYNFGEPIPNRRYCECGTDPLRNKLRTKYKNSVGGQIYMISRPRGPQAAFTAFYQHRFGNVMALKTTYTIDKFSFANIGLGLNLQAGPVNMYAMIDNLLAFRNLADSNYASFQLGLNIISWGKK